MLLVTVLLVKSYYNKLDSVNCLLSQTNQDITT